MDHRISKLFRLEELSLLNRLLKGVSSVSDCSGCSVLRRWLDCRQRIQSLAGLLWPGAGCARPADGWGYSSTSQNTLSCSSGGASQSMLVSQGTGVKLQGGHTNLHCPFHQADRSS